MKLNKSLNEIETMALRAARGAGMSWGLAQETAKSTRWLTTCNLPGAEMLSKLLELNDRVPLGDVSPVSLSGIWSNNKDHLCPIVVGSSLSDMALTLRKGNSIEMQNVAFPVFVLSFANQVAAYIQTPVNTHWSGVVVTTDGNAMSLSGDPNKLLVGHTTALRCEAANQSIPEQSTISRGSVDDECWEKLSLFAHRTYAPATEESRLLGAGAGLSDND